MLGGAGAIIVAQDNVRQRMSREQVMKSFNETVPAAAAVALPVITFTETMTLYLGSDTVDIVPRKECAHRWRRDHSLAEGERHSRGRYVLQWSSIPSSITRAAARSTR
ncbi:MAG: hypothetical protein U0133_06480 [Gemmatimonadales bacterium]